MENMKKNPQRVAQPGLVHRRKVSHHHPNPSRFSMIVPWAERMEFKSDPEEEANASSKTVVPASYEKIHATSVLEQTEKFLKSALTQWRIRITDSTSISLLYWTCHLPLHPIWTKQLLVNTQRTLKPMTIYSRTFRHTSWVPLVG